MYFCLSNTIYFAVDGTINEVSIALNPIPTINPVSEGRNSFISTKFDTITEATNGKSLQTLM